MTIKQRKKITTTQLVQELDPMGEIPLMGTPQIANYFTQTSVLTY